MTGILTNKQTLQKKLKYRPHTKNNLNFIATTHLAHLLLPAIARAIPKAKAKEPNFPPHKFTFTFEPNNN